MTRADDASPSPEGASGSMVGFWANAAAHPDRAAVVDPDGRMISYAELASVANRLSHGLRSAGIGVGSVVAVATRNHHVFPALSLATDQIGAYLVPINWHLTPTEMAYVLTNSGAQVAITGDGLEEQAREALDQSGMALNARFSVTRTADYRPLSALTEGQPTTPPENRRAGRIMFYSSGTTGRPKAVRREISERPPEAHQQTTVAWMGNRGIGPGPDVCLIAPPLYHAAPAGHALEALYLGNTLVLMDRWDSEEALAVIERYRVHRTYVAPIHLARWLSLPPGVRGRYDTSSLGLVMHAGAPCPVSLKRQAINWLGPILYEYYGGTEGPFTSVTCAEWLEHPGTVGNIHRAVPDIAVFAEDDGRPLSAGEIGLLYTRTPGHTFTYHGDDEQTRRVRRDDGFVTCGDLGYVDEEGWLYLADRRTDMINSGGVNIYPAEIEGVLFEHPAVEDVAVVARPDDTWGQRPVAVLKVRPGVGPDAQLAEQLAEHCRQYLAKFKCPEDFQFRTEIPRSSTGKLLRRVITEELGDVPR